MVRFLEHEFGAAGEVPSDGSAVMQIGDSQVMVSSHAAREATSSSFYVYVDDCYVDDCDATYGRALPAGATSLKEPRDVPCGDRRAMINDPTRNTWQIAAYRG